MSDEKAMDTVLVALWEAGVEDSYGGIEIWVERVIENVTPQGRAEALVALLGALGIVSDAVVHRVIVESHA